MKIRRVLNDSLVLSTPGPVEVCILPPSTIPPAYKVLVSTIGGIFYPGSENGIHTKGKITRTVMHLASICMALLLLVINAYAISLIHCQYNRDGNVIGNLI